MVFCPLTTTGAAELVVQLADEPRFVVDCKLNPMAVIGHVKMRLVLEGSKLSCGGGGLTDPNERLNTVPLPVLPPAYAVPYRVLPDKINPASGLAPSLLVPEETAVKL